jgi:hypothetical protein
MIFTGAAGSTVTLAFLLHTYSDQYYRSWLYIARARANV